jgi:hypothetical protein
VNERWRRPAVVLDIEQLQQGIWLPDGRVQGEVKLTLDEESKERMRLGRMCAKCQEPFEHAWPERCNVCGAPIRDKQAEFFAREFAGTQSLGPSISLEEEAATFRERAEREGTL